MSGEEKKYVVYRGSVYNTGPVYPDALWIMSEYEWDEHAYHHSSSATLLARGLTKEVAKKMIQLTEEKQT